MGVEGAHDLEGRRQDADDAISAPDEDALGAGDDAGSVPGLRWVRRALFYGRWGGHLVAYLGEERALVVGKLHLRDIEELELPLSRDQLRLYARTTMSSLTGVTAILLPVHCATVDVEGASCCRHSRLSYGHPGRRYRGRGRRPALPRARSGAAAPGQ